MTERSRPDGLERSRRGVGQRAGRPGGRSAELADIEALPLGAPITALVEHPRRPGRYEVVVGDRTAALVSARVIADLGIAVGRLLDAPLRAALARESAALAAYDKGIALLAVRARAARELERRLAREGFAAAAIAEAIARLTSEGYLDDERLSRQVARARLGGGRAGRRRVEQELARLGVDRDVARAAVAETAEEEAHDERAAAVALARRRVGALRGLAPEVARRRLFAYLARRGFESADAAEAVRIALGAGEEEREGWSSGELRPDETPPAGDEGEA